MVPSIRPRCFRRRIDAGETLGIVWLMAAEPFPSDPAAFARTAFGFGRQYGALGAAVGETGRGCADVGASDGSWTAAFGQVG